MEFEQIVLAVWVVVYAGLPLVMGTISTALNFWSRGRVTKKYGVSYQKVLWKFMRGDYRPEKGNGDFWISYLFYNIVCVGLTSLGVSKLVTEVPNQALLNGVYITCTVIAIIFAPRFIIDLCRGLKFNNKTGDLDKIIDLQKQIDELKGVDKQ